MHSCSASSGKPDSNSLDCIVFSCFLMYRDWNKWNDEGFTFLVSDVSISWVYSLVQMRFWWLMYLYCLDIRRCRCFFGSCCICKALIFAVADALFLTNVSATCFSLNLQILFSLPGMYNCIYILPFLGLEDTSFANFASASHIFDNLQIPFAEIRHLQSLKTHYRRYHRLISFEFYLLHNSLPERKDYAILLSFVGRARLQFAGLHSLSFLGGIPWLK